MPTSCALRLGRPGGALELAGSSGQNTHVLCDRALSRPPRLLRFLIVSVVVVLLVAVVVVVVVAGQRRIRRPARAIALGSFVRKITGNDLAVTITSEIAGNYRGLEGPYRVIWQPYPGRSPPWEHRHRSRRSSEGASERAESCACACPKEQETRSPCKEQPSCNPGAPLQLHRSHPRKERPQVESQKPKQARQRGTTYIKSICTLVRALGDVALGVHNIEMKLS